jgi:hypothetical protein
MNQSQVEPVLDSWKGWKAARESLLKIGAESDLIKTLGAISRSKQQSYIRRSRTIELLATFKNDEAVKMLESVTIGADPIYRCAAIRSLTSIASKSTIPVLINKVDDHAVCMQILSTDPARATDVWVSDQAISALEQITGNIFRDKPSNAHRPSRPWKEWWTKHQRH